MATILREAGRYVSHQAIHLRHKMCAPAAVSLGGLGVIAGFAMASSLPKFTVPFWGSLLVAAVGAMAIVVLAKWCFHRLDNPDSDDENYRRGAAGEIAVGLRLERFPNEFHVINDLTTPLGNLDHVVVGPTGIFIIDTKDWRGTVASDGNGELTLNNRPLDQPHVKRFLARVMEVKEKVRVLAPGLDTYFQALFVFTLARVEVSFGTTSTLHCIPDEQLHQYIVNKRFGKKLAAGEVERIAQAFLDLAHMELGLIEKAEPVQPTGRQAERRPFATVHPGTRQLIEAGA